MSKKLIFITAVLLSSSCHRQITKESPRFLSIEAINLSEDMTLFASQNDEIHLFLLKSSENHELLYHYQHVFLKGDKDTIQFSIHNNSKYSYVLLEQDEDTIDQELINSIQENFDSLKLYHESFKTDKMERFLGDNDLLGIGDFQYNDKMEPIIISSFHLFDKFEYKISTKSKNK